MTTTRRSTDVSRAPARARPGARRAPRAKASEPMYPQPALQIVQVPVTQLRPWPGNPRHMPRAEMASLQRSVSQWGVVQPLVVRRADGVVIGGHQRLEAAKALGHQTVPVIYVDLSEAEAKLLNLALNRISGEWDLPKLGELLAGLQHVPDLDETLSGFSGGEIDEILAELERQQAPDPREPSFPEASEAMQAWLEQAPTRVGAGETWALGRHRLYCGDSLADGALARLCGGTPVDLVLTDPPYGIDYQSSQPRQGSRKRKIANDDAEGFGSFLERALPAIKSVMRKGAALYWFAGGGGAEPVLAKALLAVCAHFQLLNILVWDKMDPGLGWRWRRSWEAIIEASVGRPRVWYGGAEQRNVLRFPRAIPQVHDHPTPKPVPLLAEILRATMPVRGLVLDPFAGSGATLIAAERTDRTCLAVELVPRYCDIVLFRWEALTGGSPQRLPQPESHTNHKKRRSS
jgi:DNA modification methylase